MLPNCYNFSRDFRTVFVFALGLFLTMWVLFFDFNGNFNGKMAKINKIAKNNFSKSYSENKNSSEISGGIVTLWEHANL